MDTADIIDEEFAEEAIASDEFLFTEEDTDLPNMVELAAMAPGGERVLRKIASRVLEDIDNAKDGREQYCKRAADNWTLFTGMLKPKSFPFEHAANLHLPVAMENALRIVSHLSEEIFGDWTNVVGVVPMGPQDDLAAQILSIHANWQFRTQIPGFTRQMDRALLTFCYVGDLVLHSYYDSYCKTNVHEVLSTDEFITPYSYVSVRPDFGDLPWYARVLSKYEHELEAMRDEWYDVDKVIEKVTPSWDMEPEQELAREMAKFNRIDVSDQDKRAPYRLYWYEGWIDLPGFDYQRFCKVIIDPTTRAILQLTVMEGPNWQDKIRFERQSAEHQQFQSALGAYTQETESRQAQLTELEAQHGMAQEMGDQPTQYTIVQQLHQLGMLPMPVPPEPPIWMGPDQGPPEPPRMEPKRMFVHGVCIEPLAGNIGIGYGNIWADYTRAGNTALNQFVDAATLANTKSLIASAEVEFEGKFSVGPGRINRVKNGPSPNIKDYLMPLDFAPANAQLLEVVDRIRTYAQGASQSPDVLSGAPGKSGEPYQALATRVELATKPLSAMGRRFAKGLEQVAKNNAELNAVHLPEEELITVAQHALLGYQDIENPIRVTRALYERSYDVEIRCDLRFTSMQQRVNEADEVVSMGMTHPALMPNLAFQYYALKKSFEARGRPDLIGAMGQPPPPQPFGMPPTPPPGMVPQGPPGAAPPGGPPPQQKPEEAPPAREPQAPPS